MKFAAVDVETANADLSSICQIGIAQYTNGRLTDTWKSLVDPDDFFDGLNVSIHGIDENTVRGAPNWPGVFNTVASYLRETVAVSHAAFDRAAISLACEKHALKPVESRWLDTARVARRAWPQFSKSGYGLANLAQFCGMQFRHHDALEDARAAGEILLRAIADSGLDVEQWLHRAVRPIHSHSVAQDGDPDGPLFGEVIVFTGGLSMVRHDAAVAAAAAGCEVTDGLTKHTTLLVVGDQDIRKLAGHEKSSKHRKAEDLIAKGQAIRIVRESDFLHLVALGDQPSRIRSQPAWAPPPQTNTPSAIC